MDNKQSLMHFLVSTIQRRFPDVLDFSDELIHVEKAARGRLTIHCFLALPTKFIFQISGNLECKPSQTKVYNPYFKSVNALTFRIPSYKCYGLTWTEHFQRWLKCAKFDEAKTVHEQTILFQFLHWGMWFVLAYLSRGLSDRAAWSVAWIILL